MNKPLFCSAVKPIRNEVVIETDPFLEDRKLSCRHGSQIHLVEDRKDGGTTRRTELGLGFSKLCY